MESLHKNWITEKHTDFEHKQYILLAHLKKIAEEFTWQRLYPTIPQLEEEYQNLICLKEALSVLDFKLSKEIKHIDNHNFKLVYQSIFEDDRMIKEINAILDFSIPQIAQLLKKGNKILNSIDEKIAILPVGLLPLRQKEGYLFLNVANSSLTKVYGNHLTFYESANTNYPGIKTQFIGDFKRSIAITYEYIKQDLIKANKSLPNPATYLVATELSIPIDFTFLPMAKMKLSKMIS